MGKRDQVHATVHDLNRIQRDQFKTTKEMIIQEVSGWNIFQFGAIFQYLLGIGIKAN